MICNPLSLSLSLSGLSFTLKVKARVKLTWERVTDTELCVLSPELSVPSAKLCTLSAELSVLSAKLCILSAQHNAPGLVVHGLYRVLAILNDGRLFPLAAFFPPLKSN